MGTEKQTQLAANIRIDNKATIAALLALWVAEPVGHKIKGTSGIGPTSGENQSNNTYGSKQWVSACGMVTSLMAGGSTQIGDEVEMRQL